MSRFVLDASVSAAWFLPHGRQALALQARSALATGSTAVVPALWSIEMANVLSRSVRRGVIAERDGDQAIAQLEALLISSAIEIHASLPTVSQVYSAAKRFNLKAYDAVYLTLAVEEDLPIASLDEDLRKAANKAGVTAI